MTAKREVPQRSSASSDRVRKCARSDRQCAGKHCRYQTCAADAEIFVIKRWKILLLFQAIVHPEGVVHFRLLRHAYESEFVRHESGFDPTNSGGTAQRPGTSRVSGIEHSAMLGSVI